MKKVDNIEIHPLIGIDDDLNIVKKYAEATNLEESFSMDDKAFENAKDNDEVIAWGVYLHIEGAGLESVFDVIDEENAKLARKVLMDLYNLKD